MAKREKKGLLSTISETKSIEDKEKILQELRKEEEGPVKKVVKRKPIRVSVDFPRDLYRTMKDDNEERGQTLKGFIVSLVRSHYDNKSGRG